MGAHGGGSGNDGSGDRYSVAAGSGGEPGGGSGYNAGLVVFSYIAGGILVWSLIGWGLDILLGTTWFVLAGAFVGLAGGFYLSFARRFGSTRNNDADAASRDPDETDGRQR